MSLRALENAGTGGGGGSHAHQTVSVQFEDIDQQNESYIVGMWSFLVTEIMFFGALFLLYALYRTLYFNTYLEAHQFLDVKWGTVNTFILLTSSFTMVMAVDAAQKAKRMGVILLLAATIALSFGFLGVKYIEYTTKLREGIFPDARFNYERALREHHAHGPAHAALSPRHEMAWSALKEADKAASAAFQKSPSVGLNAATASLADAEITVAQASAARQRFEAEAKKARLFFSVYFTMTGLHGVHVIIGILLMGALIWFYWTKHPCVEDYMPTELIGLYWHFVDIVWIFLFPMMYLIS
jgi:cytochrome c oxidase subunit III